MDPLHRFELQCEAVQDSLARGGLIRQEEGILQRVPA